MAATRRLAAAGVEVPRAEARRLLELATGLPRERVVAEPDRPLSATETAVFTAFLDRRAAREPFAYIAGRREFYGRDFIVHPGVLVPRPETETLVEVGLRHLDEGPRRVLDIGVGTGCLLLTFLAERTRLHGIGTDVSEAALACASANAAALGLADRLDLRRTRWAEGVGGPFDLIVSNPPYIRADELPELEPEVRVWEPRLALVGGDDGLAAYREIAAHLMRLLAPEGLALLEIGAGQEIALIPLLAGHGLRVDVHHDLAGHVRCLAAVRQTA